MQTDRGDFIQTFSGQPFFPFAPEPSDYRIIDIAHALSHVCRFTGHVDQLYTVAQHSVYVSRLVPTHARLAALLHDLSEAYICDMARPIKKSEAMWLYREVEGLIQSTGERAFGIEMTPQLHDVVKKADNLMLWAEYKAMMKPLPPGFTFCMSEPEGGFDMTYVDPYFHPWRPDQAKEVFLREYARLTNARNVA